MDQKILAVFLVVVTTAIAVLLRFNFKKSASLDKKPTYFIIGPSYSGKTALFLYVCLRYDFSH